MSEGRYAENPASQRRDNPRVNDSRIVVLPPDPKRAERDRLLRLHQEFGNRVCQFELRLHRQSLYRRVLLRVSFTGCLLSLVCAVGAFLTARHPGQAHHWWSFAQYTFVAVTVVVPVTFQIMFRSNEREIARLRELHEQIKQVEP